METDPYLKAMFGCHARRAAFNYVLQPQGEDNKAAVIGITSFLKEMAFGADPKFTHTLVVCDVVIRPHLVIASNHLRGVGMSGILMSGIASLADWLEHGEIVLNNMPSR